ncbi:winged helix-turn-helix domain-containing protein [Providencia sneebia]|uniref:Transcriptional regulator n=1 Tax=Providencia sneebia DSM 19967 TaxID=1141660 RepID=K8W6N4_9GAMM|nr:winged helix-turn-helix domain-containing protein [Providencia sneebia]EKT53127.1 transcriptional regulator [Providencia sneebia DSM 19967]
MIKHKNYLINNKFVFEINKSLIILKDNTDKFVELSKPASRLLKEIILLNQQSRIATREELLSKVWEQYGLVSSNNNLSTYISEIRKKLKKIGINPKSIITIPKRGFRFEGEVEEIIPEEINTLTTHQEIIIRGDNEPRTEEINNTSSPLNIINSDNQSTRLDEDVNYYTPGPNNPLLALANIEKPTTPVIKKNKKVKNIYILLSTAMLFIILLTLFFHFMKFSGDNMEIKNYITASERDQCIIQVPATLLDKTISENINIINKKLDKYNVSCDEPKRVVLLSDPSIAPDNDKNISLSICKDKNDKYDCISINDQRI